MSPMITTNNQRSTVVERSYNESLTIIEALGKIKAKENRSKKRCLDSNNTKAEYKQNNY